MIPTVPYIEEKFALFNKQIFQGKLPVLPIVLSDAKTFLGACTYKKKKNLFAATTFYDFKLRINKRIDLPEAEIEDVIIHEMIHYYIAYFGLKDTSLHGKVFKQFMNQINARFGRHITISRKMNEKEKEQLYDTKRRWRVIVVLSFTNGKTGVKSLPRVFSKIQDFCYKISRVVEVKSYSLYITDDPYFSRFPTSVALRIRYADAKELTPHLDASEEVVILNGKLVSRNKLSYYERM